MKKKIAIGLGALVLVIAGIKYAVTPQSYEDCVLKGLESARNERAAFLVAKVCRSKFPSYTPTSSSSGISKYTGPKDDGPNLFAEFPYPEELKK